MKFTVARLNALARKQFGSLKDAFDAEQWARFKNSEDRGQVTIWDTEARGLSVLVSMKKGKDAATVTFRVAFYLPSRPGKPRYMAIGRYPKGEYRYVKEGKKFIIQCSDIEAVRKAAGDIRSNAQDDIDPTRSKPLEESLFGQVVEKFIDVYCKKKQPRSWKETQRIFNRYVLPEWKKFHIHKIKRSDVADLLDKIEGGKIKGPNGKLMGAAITADATLTALSTLFNWYATRVDSFTTPIVRGMRRAGTTAQRARNRVLSDEELRVMWPILGEMPIYGQAVKCMLLTAQRARKVGKMRRSEIKHGIRDDKTKRTFDNLWDPLQDDDPDNKQVSVVPLSAQARLAIDSLPQFDTDNDDEWVFSTNGRNEFKGWSKAKAQLDKKMLAAFRQHAKQAGLDPNKVTLPPWQHRDLRRTARTLMARDGVLSEIAERCLGHKLKGVEGVYNRYDYLFEKRDAFARLGALVDKIVKPRKGNVVQFARRKARAR